MVKVCCVKNCDNRSTRESDRKYFSFPAAAESEASDARVRELNQLRQTEWINAIGEQTDVEAKEHLRICSDHFHSDLNDMEPDHTNEGSTTSTKVQSVQASDQAGSNEVEPDDTNGGSTTPTKVSSMHDCDHAGSNDVEPDAGNKGSAAENILACSRAAQGMIPLPGKHFMPTADVIALLTSRADVLPCIPSGLKEFVYCLIDNKANIIRRSKGGRSRFNDDCGVWQSMGGVTTKFVYLRQDDGSFTRRYLVNDLICREYSVSGKRQYAPCDPQPESDRVVYLWRYYTKLKCASEFQKRVTWIGLSESETPKALVEYVGKFPGLIRHGNARTKSERYIRTRSNAMDTVGRRVERARAFIAHQSLLRNDPEDMPAKQVRQNKHADGKKKKSILTGKPADIEDVNNVDWVPSLRINQSGEDLEMEETEGSRWHNWENFVRRIMVFLKTGAHEEELTKQEQRSIQKAAKTYYLEGGILYHQKSKRPLKVVMLEEEHREVICQFHVTETGSHWGINATVDRISSKFFWRGIKQDVVQYINQCCGRHRAVTLKSQAERDVSDKSKTEPVNEAGQTHRKIKHTPKSSTVTNDSDVKPCSDNGSTPAYCAGKVSETTEVEQSAGNAKEPQDESMILDEVEGSFVKADRKEIESSYTGTSGILPLSVIGQSVSDISPNYSGGIMPASATILKLASSASKDKAESHLAKNPLYRTKNKPTVKPELKPAPASTSNLKSPTKMEGNGQASSPKSYRSVAYSLHNIGLRLVRQQVYKSLVEIQEVKEEQNRLDEGDKKQLEKLRGYYMELRQKNGYLIVHGRRCRCGCRVGSLQELDLHQEYGHGWESGRYDCCLCKFTTKVFSIFSSHMAKEHGRRARFQLPLAPFVCPYCPFEHRHNTKKKLLKHIANCERNFQIDSNLAVRAIDADIPLLASLKQPPATNSDAGPSSVATPSGGKSQSSACATAARSQRSVLKSPSSDAVAGGTLSPAMSNSVGGLNSKMPQQKMAPVRLYEVCEICGGFVKDRLSLLIHLKVAHKVDIHVNCASNSVEPIECSACSERFWTSSSLELHNSKMHSETTDALQPSNAALSVCPLCKRTRLTDVVSHLAQQHRVTLLDMFLVRYCALCLLELHSEKAFEDHMTTSHRSLYPSRSSLMESIRNLEQHRPNNSTRPSALLLALVNRNKLAWRFGPSCNTLQIFPCPICRVHFGQIEHLTSHFEGIHKHKCICCDFRCLSAELMSRHFRTVHDASDKCQICHKEIAHGVATIEHFKEFHLQECIVRLDRVSDTTGRSLNESLDVVSSDVGRSRCPSSLSDGSSARSLSDEDGDSPPLKRMKLNESCEISGM